MLLGTDVSSVYNSAFRPVYHHISRQHVFLSFRYPIRICVNHMCVTSRRSSLFRPLLPLRSAIEPRQNDEPYHDNMRASNDAGFEEEDESLTDSWLLEPVQVTPYNIISVIQIGPQANHEFAGCTVLQLDNTNNIHSINYSSVRIRQVFTRETKQAQGSNASDVEHLKLQSQAPSQAASQLSEASTDLRSDSAADISQPHAPFPDTAFPYAVWTNCYYDEFAALPPILPPGPVAIFGLGAGSGARVLLRSWPHLRIEGWEIDSQVIRVARKYFGMGDLERFHTSSLTDGPDVPRGRRGAEKRRQIRRGRRWEEDADVSRSKSGGGGGSLEGNAPLRAVGGLIVHIGDAFAERDIDESSRKHSEGGVVTGRGGEDYGLRFCVASEGGSKVTHERGADRRGEGGEDGGWRHQFAGIIVDVFTRGKPNAELREVATWQKIARRLLPHGRLMVNCGSPAVEVLDEIDDVSSVRLEEGRLDSLGVNVGGKEVSGVGLKGLTAYQASGLSGEGIILEECEYGSGRESVAECKEEERGGVGMAGGSPMLVDGVTDVEVGRTDLGHNEGGGDEGDWSRNGTDLGSDASRYLFGKVRGSVATESKDEVAFEKKGCKTISKEVEEGSDKERIRDEWRVETDAVIRAVKYVFGSEVYGKYTVDSGSNYLLQTGHRPDIEEWGKLVPKFLESRVQDWVKL